MATSAIAVDLDVTQEADWASATARVAEQLGGLDILVNNAALMREVTHRRHVGDAAR